jgi:hypothetical protein
MKILGTLVSRNASVNPLAGFFFRLTSRWLGQLSEYVQMAVKSPYTEEMASFSGSFMDNGRL